jgi:hypothetical protein
MKIILWSNNSNTSRCNLRTSSSLSSNNSNTSNSLCLVAKSLSCYLQHLSIQPLYIEAAAAVATASQQAAAVHRAFSAPASVSTSAPQSFTVAQSLLEVASTAAAATATFNETIASSLVKQQQSTLSSLSSLVASKHIWLAAVGAALDWLE